MSKLGYFTAPIMSGKYRTFACPRLFVYGVGNSFLHSPMYVVLSSGLAVGAAESTMADVEVLQVAAATNTGSDKQKVFGNMESGRHVSGLLDSLKGSSVIYTQELGYGN
jgi:hypothetical protein